MRHQKKQQATSNKQSIKDSSIMRTACFALVALLSFVILVNASSLEHETDVRIHTKPQKGLNDLSKRGGGLRTIESQEAMEDKENVRDDETRVPIGGDKRDAQVRTQRTCITKQECLKKKVICSKKCMNSAEQGHEKCSVKCAKCVPNC